jgi:hypothetical protein
MVSSFLRPPHAATRWIRACFRAEGKGKYGVFAIIFGDRRMPEPSLTPTEPLNPSALTVAEAARLLAAAGGRPVTEEMVRAAIDAGAPVAADGRVNLVELMAWLEQAVAEKP